VALTLTLSAAATAAAQFLGVLDSGEGLSTQQLTDAFNAANSMLDNWTIEHVRLLNAILPRFSLAGGTYTPGQGEVAGLATVAGRDTEDAAPSPNPKKKKGRPKKERIEEDVPVPA